MVANTLSATLNARALLPVLAVLAGIGVAAGIATTPAATFDAVVSRAHVGDILPFAAAPVGVTGRSLVALAVGALVAALGLAGRFLIEPLPSADRSSRRRADAHPDAPPRRPLRPMEELDGALPIAAEAPVPPATCDIPADLDQPLSAFDPDAIPATPQEPVRAVPPLTRMAEVTMLPPEEPVAAVPVSSEPVAPEPVAPEPAVPAAAPVQNTIVAFSLVSETCAPEAEPRTLEPIDTGQESLGALVARLDQVARQAARARRERIAAQPSIDETLSRLRQLATG